MATRVVEAQKDPPRARTPAAGARCRGGGCQAGCGRARGCGARASAAGALGELRGARASSCGRAAGPGLRAQGSSATGGPQPSLSTGGHCGNPDLLTVPSGAWVWLPRVRGQKLDLSHQRAGRHCGHVLVYKAFWVPSPLLSHLPFTCLPLQGDI